jgi:hypothetical protein
VGKHERKGRQEDADVNGDNMKVVLKEIGWECVDWIHKAQYRNSWWTLNNRAINLPFPQIAGNSLTG